MPDHPRRLWRATGRRGPGVFGLAPPRHERRRARGRDRQRRMATRRSRPAERRRSRSQPRSGAQSSAHSAPARARIRSDALCISGKFLSARKSALGLDLSCEIVARCFGKKLASSLSAELGIDWSGELGALDIVPGPLLVRETDELTLFEALALQQRTSQRASFPAHLQLEPDFHSGNSAN